MSRRISSVIAGILVGALALSAAPRQTSGSPELLLSQAKQQFATFKYDEAVAMLTSLITTLTTGGQVQKSDLLVQAYDLRARSRFALGDNAATEQDYAALLLVNPGFALLPGTSSRITPIFDKIKKLTVGQLSVSLNPPGDLEIDGKAVPVGATAQTIDLPVGEHTIKANRPGYRPVEQKMTISGGTATPLEVVLERVSSTLAVVSQPAGVEVLFDGTSKGRTPRGAAATGPSGTLMLNDLPVGNHRLQLKLDCYTDFEQTIPIDHPTDLKVGPITLTPAVATAKVTTTASDAFLYVDGAPRGRPPADINNLCAGPHLIEVRGPKGRFIDRRDWKAGDSATINATLRSAFPIVSVKGTGPAADQLRGSVERLLSPVKGVLVYVPTQSEVDQAMAAENIPADWLSADTTAGDPASSRLAKTVRRDRGTKLAARLQVQGLAAVAPGPDQFTILVSLLAAGSGEPDVLAVNTADTASQTRLIETLSAALPPLTRLSLETSVVDLAGTPGAAVVRPGGAGAKAGLVAGDLIVGAAGKPVASVADLRATIAAMRPNAPALPLQVKGPAGATRAATVTAVLVPDAIPLSGPGLFNNRDLVELQDALQAATAPLDKAAVHLNLAIVHLRLANWDEALAELKEVTLPDGPGVSAGTVAYLTGLAYERQARIPDARAAYTKAAASPQARLSNEGPLVAILAQKKLREL